MSKPEPVAVLPLTPDQVNKLGGACHRLAELNGLSVVTPTHEAEKAGLQNFINETFFAHAAEFIGMWFISHEYRNLIQLEARKLRRIHAAAAALEQVERAPDPVKP